jgi:restriction system protein
MRIPDFQTLMRPLLEHLADGAARPNQDTLEAMAQRFRVTDEERSELFPSGKQPVFHNRVAWAKSHLKGAGLIESPQRAVYKITERGQALLQTHPGPIGMSQLKQYPEYLEFRTGKSQDDAEPKQVPASAEEITPEEHLEYGYSELRKKLVSDILDEVSHCPPEFFERLVVELLVAMGYGGSRADAGRAVGKSGDGGIDGIIKEDRLGLDVIYIQAKRWEGTVGRPEIQKFAGALQGVRAKKGIFLTSSSFSADAIKYSENIDNKIILIDGRTLAGLMIDHDVGVTRVQNYEIKRLDSDYFQVDEQ